MNRAILISIVIFCYVIIGWTVYALTQLNFPHDKLATILTIITFILQISFFGIFCIAFGDSNGWMRGFTDAEDIWKKTCYDLRDSIDEIDKIKNGDL